MQQAPAHDWLSYINITRTWRPRQVLIEALPYVAGRESALDLGSGALFDSRLLLSEGFQQVTAIDSAIDETQARELLGVSEELLSHFTFINSAIEDFIFPVNQYDLINAQFVLPFLERDNFDKVMINIKQSLKSGGIFVGQFLGHRDTWAEISRVSVFTEDESRQYLNGLEIIEFREEERNGHTATKVPKHWHIFHFITRKNN